MYLILGWGGADWLRTSFVRRLKGLARPGEIDTACATEMAALSSVDLVLQFDQDTLIDLIRARRLDVLENGSEDRSRAVGKTFSSGEGGPRAS